MPPSHPCTLHLRPRYHSFLTENETTSRETNGSHQTLDWQLPLTQAALILIDVWNWHYLSDTRERIDTIVANRIVPLVDAARHHGLRIIHSPAPSVANRSPLYRPLECPATPRPEWPPAAFCEKQGPYAAYARPENDFSRYILHHALHLRDFHPLIPPVDGDAIIANGQELQHLLQNERRLFLFYAGFHNNACLLLRDSGIPAMRNAGYETILLRDCTTAMESPQSQRDNLQQTQAATLLTEMFLGYTLTSQELIAALASMES